MIQKTGHLDSIVARALLAADFIDSIDPSRTWRGLVTMEFPTWSGHGLAMDASGFQAIQKISTPFTSDRDSSGESRFGL